MTWTLTNSPGLKQSTGLRTDHYTLVPKGHAQDDKMITNPEIKNMI